LPGASLDRPFARDTRKVVKDDHSGVMGAMNAQLNWQSSGSLIKSKGNLSEVATQHWCAGGQRSCAG
jgi:hypothetical protein